MPETEADVTFVGTKGEYAWLITGGWYATGEKCDYCGTPVYKRVLPAPSASSGSVPRPPRDESERRRQLERVKLEWCGVGWSVYDPSTVTVLARLQQPDLFSTQRSWEVWNAATGKYEEQPAVKVRRSMSLQKTKKGILCRKNGNLA